MTVFSSAVLCASAAFMAVCISLLNLVAALVVVVVRSIKVVAAVVVRLGLAPPRAIFLSQ